VSVSAAKVEANNKYSREAYEQIALVVRRGAKDKIKEFAKSKSESLNGFITRAIFETMEREGGREMPEYKKADYDTLNVIVPLGEREKIQEMAEKNGETINQYILRLVREDRAKAGETANC